jgi:hypothetical protein
MDSEIMGTVREMRFIIVRTPCGAKRAAEDQLESQPKRRRSLTIHDAVDSAEEAERVYENKDIVFLCEGSNEDYFGDTEDNMEIDMSSGALHDHRATVTERPAGNVKHSGNAADTTTDGECYGFTTNHITIHLVSGERILKRRAHTHPYIDALGLQQDVLQGLDKDPSWTVGSFERGLLAKAERRIFCQDTRRRWITAKLKGASKSRKKPFCEKTKLSSELG